LLFIIFSSVVAFYSLRIFIVFIGASALYFWYTLLFLKKRELLDYKRFQEVSENQTNIIEIVEGMQDIKANNAESKKHDQWHRNQVRLFKISQSSMRLQQWQESGSVFINECKNIIITGMSALSVINGDMTLGMMLSIQYMIGQLNVPLNDFVSISRDWQDAKISINRTKEIQHQREEHLIHEPQLSAEGGIEIADTIAFQNVSFQHSATRGTKALNDISFTIPAGKITAIVGSSGSGKTTLLKLLMKFYVPTSGHISIDNRSLEDLPADLWRAQCGAVLQDGYIFNDTIAGNISLSKNQIDFEKLQEAARIANILEFIESLPLQFDTRIGSDGINMSAGQRQRILIARAVYKNAQILLFDEATSALDANNERTILGNLSTFLNGKTVVVIAHRLSTVKNADQIIVLEAGMVKEVGTHNQLKQRAGLYFELVKNQLETVGEEI
jgi:ATP-binding cassette subfamily B protein